MASDSAQLERVRNRLAASLDSKLPHILLHLLPKLVPRFPTTPSTNTASTNGDDRHHLRGIFVHVNERIRLNSSIVQADWVEALLHSVVNQKHKENDATLATLPILEVALLHCQVHSALGHLLTLLERLHTAVAEMDDSMEIESNASNEQEDSDEAALLAAWERLRWMIVEQIAKNSSMRPILDWDHLGDEWDDWHASANFQAIQPYPPTEEERCAVRPSAFALLLDAVTFDPGQRRRPHMQHQNILEHQVLQQHAEEGVDNGARWQFRREAVPHNETFDQIRRQRDMARQLADAQIRGDRHGPVIETRRLTRRQRNHRIWSDTEQRYWKALQYAVKLYAVELFSDDRETVLRIVTGQVKTVVPVYKPPPVSAMYKHNARKKKKCENKHRCSLTVANTLLRLIVGDTAAEALCKETLVLESCRDLLGNFAVNKRARFAKLPMDASERSVSFLKQAEIETSMASTNDLKLFLALLGELHKHLPSDISAQIYEHIGARTSPAVCWNVHFLHKMTRNKSSDSELDEFMAKTAWEAALRLLSELQDASMHRFERIRRMEVMRGNDRRIQEHRERLALQNPFVSEALAARAEAYQLVSRFLTVDRLMDGVDRVSWDVAVQMLNCVAFDQRKETLPALQAASMDVVSLYSEAIRKQSGEDFPVELNPLLLPMLKACTSTSDWSREFSLQWATDILYHLDPQLVQNICSCLGNDNNVIISNRAKDSLKRLAFPSLRASIQTCEITFFDLGHQDEKEAVLADLKQRTKLVASEQALSPRAARLVLMDFDFRTNAAIDALKNDWMSTVTQSGAEHMVPIAQQSSPSESSTCEICEICFENISDATSFSLRCNHRFCRQCWKEGFAAASGDGTGAIVNLTCLRHDCAERCTKEDVIQVSPGLKNRVEEAHLEWFILKSPDYCFCPGADCTVVAESHQNNTSTGAKMATCKLCDTSFCFHCRGEPHQPASCELKHRYTRESERVRAHIDGVEQKQIACPNCTVPITKNGGCNHMNHVCNVFDDLDGVDDLERIQFFRHRVDAHLASAAMTQRLLDEFERWSIELRERSPFCAAKHLDILKTAWKTAIVARKYLANSYVAAFGMNTVDDLVRKKFETHQSQLQVFLEQLNLLSDTVQHLCEIEDHSDFEARFNGLYFCSAAVSGYIQRVESFMIAHFDD